MPDLITFEIARDRIKAVAEERPDYVNAVPSIDEETEEPSDRFEECFYFNEDGSPSCIVGTAFAVELTERDVHAGAVANKTGIIGLVWGHKLALTPRAAYFLQIVQEEQDEGATWSATFENAVEKAAEKLPRLRDDRISSGYDF